MEPSNTVPLRISSEQAAYKKEITRKAAGGSDIIFGHSPAKGNIPQINSPLSHGHGKGNKNRNCRGLCQPNNKKRKLFVRLGQSSKSVPWKSHLHGGF